jgi:ribosomal RNA-processing protein 1
VPISLAFHICDVYLEELDKALVASSLSPAPLSTILAPFFTLAARTQTKTTYKHIQDTIFDPLFKALKSPQGQESNYSNLALNSCVLDPKEGALGPPELRKAMLRRIFDVASEEGTRDSNRRKMYSLFKAAKEDEDDSGSGS